MRKVLVGVGLVLALAAPRPAQALDQNVWQGFCSMGSLTICANVWVSVSGGTLTMRVQNLQGLFGDAHTITAVGLANLGYTGTLALGNVTYFDNAGGSTNITGSWGTPSSDISNLGGVAAQLTTGTTGNAGINGCTQLPGGTKWLTCLTDATPGYVEFTFTATSFTMTDATGLRWHSQQIGDDLELSVKCDEGGSGDYPPCSVVPEPISMVLLGTGLAGLGGVGALRRRRTGLDVENG